MFYCYKEVRDEFQNRLVIRVCQPTSSLQRAKSQLARQEIGEIRDEHHRLLAIKVGPDTRWVKDILSSEAKS